MLLTTDNQTREMPADGSSNPENVEVVSAAERSAYNDIFLSKLGPAQPSVLMLANFSQETGSVMT